jgi:hypothetical protein
MDEMLSNRIKEEVYFWDMFLKETTVPNHPSREYLLKQFNKEIEGSPYITNLIDTLQTSKCKILDVGSGPIPVLYKKYKTNTQIVCVDLLAKEYYKLYKKYRIYPPIIPLECDCEHLSDVFPEDYFDIVYAKNSIDHTQNPLKCIEEMVRVSNSYVMLDSYVNTGTSQRFNGLHQWDFYVNDNSFFIKHKDGSIVLVNDAFPNIECVNYVEHWRENEDFESINVIIKK